MTELKPIFVMPVLFWPKFRELFREHTRSIAEIKEANRKGAMAEYRDVIFIPGQAIDPEEYRELGRLLNEHGVKFEPLPEPIDCRLVHKHKPENVLIGNLLRIDAGHYRTQLVVNPRSAELNDHTTGIHISGSTMKEARRQTFIGTTELGFLTKSDDVRFVWQRSRVEYRRFVAPVPVDIEIKFERSRLKDVGGSFAVHVTFNQGGATPAAEYWDEFLVLPLNQSERLERQAAARAMELNASGLAATLGFAPEMFHS